MQDSYYRICVRCVMDTTDPEIVFDKSGVCNHCKEYEAMLQALPSLEELERQLDILVESIKAKGKGNDYDCIIGLSGGVDSSYLAYVAKSRGLRPLAIHVDAGWNSELAVKNIEDLVNALDIDLITRIVDLLFFHETVFPQRRNLDRIIPSAFDEHAALFQYATFMREWSQKDVQKHLDNNLLNLHRTK